MLVMRPHFHKLIGPAEDIASMLFIVPSPYTRSMCSIPTKLLLRRPLFLLKAMKVSKDSCASWLPRRG